MPDSGINILFQGRNFVRLLEGLLVTINISLISVIISILLGLILGIIMTFKNPIIQFLSRLYNRIRTTYATACSLIFSLFWIITTI